MRNRESGTWNRWRPATAPATCFPCLNLVDSSNEVGGKPSRGRRWESFSCAPPFPVLLDAIGAEPAVGILGDHDAFDHDRCGTQGVPGNAGTRSRFARVQLEPVQGTSHVADHRL